MKWRRSLRDEDALREPDFLQDLENNKFIDDEDQKTTDERKNDIMKDQLEQSK